MPRSNFSPAGLQIGDNNANMTYLYGISDFFSVMFEDTSRVNLLLEADSEVASEVYSRFLQMTSTISLADIQNTLGQTLKLVTVRSTDIVPNEVNTYTLPSNIITSRYIANRPLLPTALLENTVDFRIEKKADGTSQIRFAKDISNAGFSTRLLNDETTKEYALWFVDAEIDEAWISTHYASLIGVDPATSSDAFKNLVYGLYYIYIQGPTLDMLRKGLNLCLGVPLARDNETVLEIRTYLETDQYIVITDANQYLIPYVLSPAVVEGDVLSVGDELAQWVEVKDYINDGDWWINLMIPSTLIPDLPSGQINRYATQGSHYDYLMRQYLKKHTFLVNVKVQDSKSNQVFTQLSDIIKRAKPAYTQAVYIWTIPQLEETFSLEEDLFIQRRDQFRCDNLTYPIEELYRNNTSNPLMRGCPTFMRNNVPMWVGRTCGTDKYINADPIPYDGGTSYGFINPASQFRSNTDAEKAWLLTINDRSSENLNMTRSKLGFFRGAANMIDSDPSGIGVHPIFDMVKIPPGTRVIPLYLTTQKDLKDKCDSSFIRTPDITEWCFDLMNPLGISSEINALAINEGLPDTGVGQLSQNFNTWVARGPTVNYLSNVIPELGFNSYTIPSSGEVLDTDYLIGIRVYDNVVGIYWVTNNYTITPDPYATVEENDSLEVTFSTPPTRGMGPTTSSFYLTRGRGILNYNNLVPVINEAPINDGSVPGTILCQYSDEMNALFDVTREGNALVHKMEIK